jgi:Fur family peroxide stress response transcriptional regulator
MTHQRLEIYRELASSESHPDAIIIHKRVSRRIPTISLDTVYRNLRLLEKRGLISIVGKSRERLRFDADLGPHHHFTCVRCWKICDFRSDESRRLDCPEAAKAFGEPLSVHLEVRGICRSCQKP